MRTLLRYLFTVPVALIILTSCNRNSKRTLLVLPTKQETLAREMVILAYADSINNHLPTFLKHESLFYYLGENAFYVTKYHDLDQKNIVYIKHNHIGKTKIIEQIYYIRNGQTVLVETTKKSKQSNLADTIKTYFYNQAAWMPQSEIQLAGYNLALFNTENTVLNSFNWLQEIKVMEDALKQQGNFELVFEDIAEYPKAKYIILSQDKINTYRAPIKIEKEDALVTELRSNPERFRGRKLLITCEVRDKNEAIYVSGKPR